MQGTVARAVCVFDEGANKLISVINRMFIDISHITLQLLSQKDERRISQADAAATADARERRKDYATQRRLNAREEDARDGQVYGAGLH